MNGTGFGYTGVHPPALRPDAPPRAVSGLPSFPVSRRALGFLRGTLLACVLAALPVHADESLPAKDPDVDLASLSLEQLLQVEVPIVYGPSRLGQKATRAPATVTLVSAEEIRKYGYRSLAEALNSLPGIFVTDDRQFQYLGVRGFLRPGDYMGRVLLLMDGHRINENTYGGMIVGPQAIVDVDLVECIEFIPGPGSPVYGNNAFLGVLNVRTRRAADINGLEASAEAGSHDTYSTRITYGKQFANDLGVIVSASLYESAGDESIRYEEFDAPDGRGIARGMDAERAYRVFVSVAKNGLTLSGGVSTGGREVPTAPYGMVFNDPRSEYELLRAYADLKYEGEIGDDTRILARLYYDRSDYTGRYPFPTGVPGFTIVNRDETSSDWVGAEVPVSHTLFDVHTILAGVDYRENFRQYRRNYDEEPRREYLDTVDSRRDVGAYVQAEVQLRPRLHLTAGIRYDKGTRHKGTWNPRAGLIYQPWETTTLKALFGRAFRAPNELELHSNPADGYIRNDDLDPERISTYELAWEQRLGRRHTFRVSGYLYRIDGLISQVDPLFYDNVEQVTGRGVELMWEGRLHHGIITRASYSLQRAEDDDTNRELSNAPEHMLKWNINVPVWRERVFAGLQLRYQGEVGTVRGGTADDFLLTDFTLYSRELAQGLEVSASLYNVFDVDYAYPGAAHHLQETIPQEGRTFRLKLTYRF